MTISEKNTTAGRLADIIIASKAVIVDDGEMKYLLSENDKLVLVNCLMACHLLAQEKK